MDLMVEDITPLTAEESAHLVNTFVRFCEEAGTRQPSFSTRELFEALNWPWRMLPTLRTHVAQEEFVKQLEARIGEDIPRSRVTPIIFVSRDRVYFSIKGRHWP